MTKRKFAGDDTHRLPAGMRETYRLWFEFLKLALRDSRLKSKVNKKFYAEWGDVENAKFDKWWDGNWRHLFGIPLDVLVVDPRAVDAMHTDDRILISLQANAPIEQTVKEIKAIMNARGTRTGRKDTKRKRQGRFAISSGVEIKRKNMQEALKVYELSMIYGDDGVKIARAYLEWSNAWNDKIKSRGWKREKIAPPPYLDTFLKQQIGQNSTAGFGKGGDSPESNRRKMSRLIARAQKIAANVARGEFPGRY